MTLVDPAVNVVDFVRDQWFRPLIVPVDGGKPVPYTRSSTAAKTVEDQYNLEMWARRNIVFGMAHDRSLEARVLALGGTPSTWDMKTKAKANKIHEAAAEVALAHKAADIGTALHEMTEIVDRGEPLIAGAYEADVEAYRAALAAGGFEVDRRWIECRLVCDELQMAGTADRILTRDGRHLIADLKTGETVDYGGLGWAAQLAAYSHSQLYDVEAGERIETPPIDRTTGIIIHLPAGKGVCTLYEIDLVAGYRAAQLANEIRAVRREAKRWIQPLATAAPIVEAIERHPSNGRRDALRARYRALTAEQRAAFLALPVMLDDLDAIEVALDGIEQGTAAASPSVVAAVPTKGEIVEQLGRGHDEGGELPAEQYDAVRARYEALPDALQFWIGAVAAEARRAGVSFLLNTERTWRRYWLWLGLIELAEHGVDDPEAVRRIVARVTGSEAPLFPAITLGHAVGAMGVEQALDFGCRCAERADT